MGPTIGWLMDLFGVGEVCLPMVVAATGWVDVLTYTCVGAT
jgi:hypothetical protein